MRAVPRRLGASVWCQGRTCKLTISVPKRTSNGASVGLVGSCKSAGNWNTKNGVQLSETGSSVWYGELQVPAGDLFEYKFYTHSPTGHLESWQPGNNLLLDIPLDAEEMLVTDNWAGNDRVMHIFEASEDAPARAEPASKASPLQQQMSNPPKEQHPEPVDFETPSSSEQQRTSGQPSRRSPERGEAAGTASREDSQPQPLKSATASSGNQSFTPKASPEQSQGGMSSDQQNADAGAISKAVDTAPGLSAWRTSSNDVPQESLGRSTEHSTSREDAEKSFTQASLTKLTVKDLRGLSKERGLPQKRLKAELVQAILSWQESQ